MRPASGSKGQNYTNRAEELRKKRTERSKQRIDTVSGRIVNPVQPRPVIVRNNARQGGWFGQTGKRKSPVASTPIYQQSSSRARRAFYVTMDQTSGAELRLPTIPLVNPGWRLVSGLVVILMIIGIYSLWGSPFFQVSSVEVSGLKRIGPNSVNKVLALQDTSIVEVDANAVKEKLAATYPEMINIQVSVSVPNIVSVTAEERKPVIAFQKGDKITWADAEGVLFPARGKAGKLVTVETQDNLPLAPQVIIPVTDTNGEDSQATPTPTPAPGQKSGIPLTGPRKVDPSLLAAAEELSKKLPPETKLVYSKENGLGWTDPGGWQVYIGKNLQDFDAKFEMYKQITRSLADQGLKPTVISVEQLNAPFYRLEQQSDGG